MNKYAKLLAIVFFVSSVSPVFAASTTSNADTNPPLIDNQAPKTDKKGEGCLAKTGKCAWTVAYGSPFEGKYTWNEAQDCTGKLKFFGKHTLRAGGRIAAVVGTVAGITALIKYLKGDFKAEDEFADEEANA